MGDDVGLCHMCYQRDAGRSEEELSVEQEQFSETASDGNFVNTVGEGTLPHSRWAVAILHAVIIEADANDSDTSKCRTEGRASLVRAPGTRRQRGPGSATSPGSSGCSGSLAAVVDACPAGIGGCGQEQQRANHRLVRRRPTRGIRNLAVLVALRLRAGHAAQGRLRLIVKSDSITAIIAVLKGGERGRGGQRPGHRRDPCRRSGQQDR